MAKVTGAARHIARLQNARVGVRREVGRAVFVGAGQIETQARQLIIQNAIQGKGHIPSRPGEPPNRDTGQLDQSIVSVKTGELTAETSANAQSGDYSYAVGLEFGNTKVAERPYMRPATRLTRKRIERLVRRAVSIAIRRT